MLGKRSNAAALKLPRLPTCSSIALQEFQELAPDFQIAAAEGIGNWHLTPAPRSFHGSWGAFVIFVGHCLASFRLP